MKGQSEGPAAKCTPSFQRIASGIFRRGGGKARSSSLQILIGKLEIQSRAVLPYVCRLACFWDDDDVLLLKQPRQGYLRWGGMVSCGDQSEPRMVQHALLLPWRVLDR